jgi:hypothetical protein
VAALRQDDAVLAGQPLSCEKVLLSQSHTVRVIIVIYLVV